MFIFLLLHLEFGVGISLDVQHEGGGGVSQDFGILQLGDEHGMVGELAFLSLVGSHCNYIPEKVIPSIG
jgi:hypothetical protein